jgi:CheY-like chemotaxis protein
MSILYVDDSADERELFEVRFGLLGARVHTVSDVAQALDSLSVHPVDLLVSDIRLDGQDGYDLIRTVRTLPPEEGGLIPAVAVTALVRDVDREKALDAGFDRHISKPYDVDALVHAVEDLGDLIERLRDFRAVLQASRARNRNLHERLGERQVVLQIQRDRQLERVLAARTRLARSVEVLRATESYLRGRVDLGPIDQLSVGRPVKVADESEVWFVTVQANERRVLVEATIEPGGAIALRQLGKR